MPVLRLLAAFVFLAPIAQGLHAREAQDELEGFVLQRSLVRGADGSEVPDGAFSATHPDGRRVEGTYDRGQPSGRWRFVNAAGKSVAVGSYVDGRRSGVWTHRSEGGVLLAKGNCTDGRPAGQWTFYVYRDKEKKIDADHSGEYAWSETSYSSGGPRAAGLLLDGQPHGPWTYWWKNGKPMLHGHLHRGRWTGSMSFALPTGHLDEDFMGAEIEAPTDLTWLALGPWIPGTTLQTNALENLPPATAEALGGELPARLNPEVAAGSQDSSLAFAVGFDRVLEALGKGGESSEERDRAVRNLHRSLGGRSTGWSWVTPELAGSSEVVHAHRARAFYECTKDDQGLWGIGLAASESTEPGTDWLPEIDALHLAGLPKAQEIQGGRHGLRRSLKKRYGIEEAEPALEAALQWLAAHQSADGRFDVEEFPYAQGVDKVCRCDGKGRHEQNLGATALALQVFVEDGNRPFQGPYSEVVLRGTRWILRQQDQVSGAIADVELGARKGGKIPQNLLHSSIYDHAIAAGYLARLWQLSAKYSYLGPVTKATQYIAEQRILSGGWSYKRRDQLGHDASITGWCWRAMEAAGVSGVDVPSEILEGTLSMIHDVSDYGTGRVGYRHKGSWSARVVAKNDTYPPNLAEPLTAVGLLVRLQLGQTIESHPIVGMHADLLLKSLPEWDPSGHRTDMYYWYYGSFAMRRLGGKYWEAWRKAMERAVLEGQRQDGHAAGSWDPIGPWGWSGGRVYATAMMAHCLLTLMPPLD